MSHCSAAVERAMGKVKPNTKWKIISIFLTTPRSSFLISFSTFQRFNTIKLSTLIVTIMDEIRNLIARFANSFDLKDWKAMQLLLMEQVCCDYTSLRKTKMTLTAEEYVQQRIDALEKLQTQHLLFNLEISISDDQATCRCSAFILRRLQEDFFNTHAVYKFTLFYKNDRWLIGKIKQEVLWNEGNPEIHSGLKHT